MDTFDIISDNILLLMITGGSPFIIWVIGAFFFVFVLRPIMKKLGVSQVRIDKIRKFLKYSTILLSGILVGVMAYLTFPIWYVPIVYCLLNIFCFWLIKWIGSLDYNHRYVHSSSGGSSYHRHGYSSSAGYWHTDEDDLDDAELDEDFNDNVNDYHDREDYEF